MPNNLSRIVFKKLQAIEETRPMVICQHVEMVTARVEISYLGFHINVFRTQFRVRPSWAGYWMEDLMAAFYEKPDPNIRGHSEVLVVNPGIITNVVRYCVVVKA